MKNVFNCQRLVMVLVVVVLLTAFCFAANNNNNGTLKGKTVSPALENRVFLLSVVIVPSPSPARPGIPLHTSRDAPGQFIGR